MCIHKCIRCESIANRVPCLAEPTPRSPFCAHTIPPAPNPTGRMSHTLLPPARTVWRVTLENMENVKFMKPLSGTHTLPICIIRVYVCTSMRAICAWFSRVNKWCAYAGITCAWRLYALVFFSLQSVCVCVCELGPWRCTLELERTRRSYSNRLRTDQMCYIQLAMCIHNRVGVA